MNRSPRDIRHTRELFLERVRRLGRDEGGTTLTEFVIILPVFILIFAAMLRLSRIHHSSVEVQITATRQMWNEALQVERSDSVNSSFASSSEAVNDALDKLDERDEPTPVDGLVTQRWNALENQGHFGESWTMVSPLISAGYTSSDLDLDEYSKVHSPNNARFDEDPSNQLDPTNTLNDVVITKVARNLFNDAGSADDMPSAVVSTDVPQFNQASTGIHSFTGTRMANGAGVRYGIALGKEEQTLSLIGFASPLELKAGFDTLVAPHAHSTTDEQMRTVGMTRLTMQDENLYQTLPGLQTEETFQYNLGY